MVRSEAIKFQCKPGWFTAGPRSALWKQKMKGHWGTTLWLDGAHFPRLVSPSKSCVGEQPTWGSGEAKQKLNLVSAKSRNVCPPKYIFNLVQFKFYPERRLKDYMKKKECHPLVPVSALHGLIYAGQTDPLCLWPEFSTPTKPLLLPTAFHLTRVKVSDRSIFTYISMSVVFANMLLKYLPFHFCFHWRRETFHSQSHTPSPHLPDQ